MLRPARVADPFHFRPDPDPANQNFKTRSRIWILLKKTTFFLSRIFFAWFMPKKKFSMSPEVSTLRNFCHFTKKKFKKFNMKKLNLQIMVLFNFI